MSAQKVTSYKLRVTSYKFSAFNFQLLHLCLCVFVFSPLAAEFANPAAVWGVKAVGTNPAQLAVRNHPRFSYEILSLEADAGNNSFTFGQYNRYNGAYLGDSAKQELAASIPGPGFQLHTGVQATLLGFTTGECGLAVQSHTGVGASVPKDLFDLALWGNRLNREYSASSLSGDAISFCDATLAWATPLGRGFALGLGLKYLRGLFVAQNIQSDGYLITTPCVINSEVLAAYRWATGGNGFGLDLGLAYEFSKHWHFGLSVLNLTRGITWTEGIQTGLFRASLDSFNVERIKDPDVASVTNQLNGSSAFRTPLPTYVNLGASYQPVPYLTLGASVLEGTANTVLSSTRPRAMAAAEYRGLHWLPLGVDLSVGGSEGFAMGGGLGVDLKRFLLRARLANLQGIALSARGIRLALSLTYYSQAPGILEPEPSILRLGSDPAGSRRF
jgi:hypothetical protein